MSEKDWNELQGGDPLNTGDWSNPFETDTDLKDTAWKDAFLDMEGDTEAAEELAPGGTLPGQGDTFALDESYFGPESDYEQPAEQSFAPPVPAPDLSDTAQLPQAEDDFDVQIPEFTDEDYDMEDY